MVFSLIGLFNCSLKEPQAPEWDTKLNLPLISEKYYMSELADTTDDFIFAVENDTMQFSFSGELDTMRIGDELKVGGQTESFNKQIGDELQIEERMESFNVQIGDELKIDSLISQFDKGLDRIVVEATGEAQAEIDLSESLGEVQGTPIPPYYNIPSLDTEFLPFPNENIEYVVIDSGFAHIDFINNTEIPLSSSDPEHYMKIEIYGNPISPENLILDHEIDHIIQAGSTESVELNLSGKKVYMNNSLRVYLTTDGTGTEPANISEGDLLVIKFSISEMTVTEASAKLPAEHIQHIDEIPIEDDEIQLTSAKIDSCVWNIKIKNNLPISANVTIQFDELFDTFDNLAQIDLEIAANDSLDYHLDFSGYEIRAEKQILDALHFSYFVTTDSTDGFVTIDETQSIYTKIELSEMWFEEVSGYVDQSFEHQDSFSIEDESGKIILQQATIKNGFANIELSGLSFEPEIKIIFDKIKDEIGNPVEITNTDFVNYNFANHSIIVSPDQIVHYNVNVNTPADIITITSTDNVNADITISDLIFQEITGIINDKRIDLDDMDEEIDLGEFADTLQGIFLFQNAELQLEIDNGIGFNCDLILHLTGENNSGDSVQIDIEESIIPGEPIIITDGIPELLNIFPTHIKIQDSYAEINGNGTISKDNIISGSYTLQTPLKFIINNHTMKMDSLEHIEIDEDTQDIIEENFNSVKLLFTTENSLPFGTITKLYFTNDSTEIWTESEDSPYLIIDSLSILADETSEIEISLDEINATQNFDVFLNPDVYLGVEFSIIGTDGNEVTIYGSDNIRIFGYLEVNVHISE